MTETREKLARAAIRLFVRKGLAATTTKEIAAAARLSEGTIYRYFPSKEEMAAQLFRENYVALTGELHEATRGIKDPLDRVAAMVACFYRMFDENRELFAFLFLASPRQPALPASTMSPLRLLREALNEVPRAGWTAHASPELATQLVLGLVTRPAEAVLAGHLPGPLAPNAPAVGEAIRRLLKP